MADAPEIKVKLTAEDTGVSAAIKELTSQLKNLKKQQDETAASGISLANAFKGIVAIGGAIELGRIGKEAFDSAISIGKMADKTGLTTQTLSVYHHVAEEAGVSTEAVDKALTKAAKSITEFEQGSAKAAKGFQLLGITQKDFAGLKPDEKIALVTSRLGAMSAGFQKATATQLIFSKGGAEFIPVANAIAAEGFDKVTESARRLGLLLDQKTTDSFRVAKASMTELEAVGKGMATQFEAGLLPAIIDVSGALTDSLTQGGVSFQDLGKYAGNAVRGIALIFLGLGQTLGTVAESIYDAFSQVWKEIKNEATTEFAAIGKAIHGNFTEALKILDQGLKNSATNVAETIQRQKAIYGALGDSFKQDYKDLFQSPSKKPPIRPENQTDAPEVTAAAAPTDAAAKAALALLEKQLQDEISLHRAYARQTEQVDKEMFDRGEITLAEYYDRRKTAITADALEEVEILRQGLAAAEADVQRAAKAKATAATPKDADKQEAARLQALAKVDDLQTKLHETQINASTKVQALNDEEFKKREENDNKVLEFQKQIAALQGKQQEVTRADIAQEAEKLRIQLAQAGQSKQQIDAEIAQFTELKTAQADFADAETKLQQDTKSFDIEKQRIEIEAKTRKISQIQAEKELNDLIAARLPLLRADAQAELSAAQKTGNQDHVASAQNAVAGVENLKQSTTSLGDTVRSSISSDFGNFFENLGRSTASAANQFRSLASSVVASLEQILVKLLLVKIFGGATGGAGGGGILGGLFGAGHAEGGLIRGPGGPKSDSIPARVSPGEYIVKADAVSAFGVQNLEAINRGLKIPSLDHLTLPKFAEGGLVGNAGGGGNSNISLGIGLDEGLILKHLSSKAAGNIILQHLTNNPKAASKALSRSQ
jgi:lambda family phage tail tape measure protein